MWMFIVVFQPSGSLPQTGPPGPTLARFMLKDLGRIEQLALKTAQDWSTTTVDGGTKQNQTGFPFYITSRWWFQTF